MVEGSLLNNFLIVKETWLLYHFFMMLKAILCVQHFCGFGAMLFIVNLLMKADSIVICFP